LRHNICALHRCTVLCVPAPSTLVTRYTAAICKRGYGTRESFKSAKILISTSTFRIDPMSPAFAPYIHM
jgi:hypothetical protein